VGEVRTLYFNTGRRYTAHGQRITATLHEDGVITFCDHDRGIEGELLFSSFEDVDQQTVMVAYDRGQWKSTQRSREDGMYRGGCNTEYKA
jgi:hypothetical protein